MAANISSRTRQGETNHCPVCGEQVHLEPSEPPGDAPCPNCGILLWFNGTSRGTWFLEAKKLNRQQPLSAMRAKNIRGKK